MSNSWPNGLHLYENVLTQEQTKKLYNFIDNEDWDDPDVTRISRAVQHYGFRYPYRRGKNLNPLPKAVRSTPLYF